MTLQEIGTIYGLTRMRICQIEKSVYEKLHLPVLD
jgi:DNA-directed RNA polymerase sigma subunit (sigma70/sigma32)